MTNYEIVLRMMPEQMERFLDQVYLAGLNTGMYAASNNDDNVLDEIHLTQYGFPRKPRKLQR